MSVTADDLQVFITTYNREVYLREALESVLNQTARVKNVVVLDNESPDNTEQVVAQYRGQGVRYEKTHGFLGNFRKAREIVGRKFVMLFHDDDILHPGYFDLALRVLNTYPELTLIATRYTEFENGNIPKSPRDLSTEHYYFDNQRDFARHMYFVERIAYATAIYKTDDFLKTPLEYEKYNKFNDWPFMVKVAAHGPSLLFNDCSLFFIRRHAKQDTWTTVNTPSLEQIVNWDKCFHDAMKVKPALLSIDNQMFRLKCRQFMEGKYRAFLPPAERERHSIESLWKTANDAGLHPSTTVAIPQIRQALMKWYVRRIMLRNRRNAL
jgi:glycosyltransferase involved in cell wall biosynthesis